MRFAPFVPLVTLTGLTVAAPTYLHRPARPDGSKHHFGDGPSATKVSAVGVAKANADALAHRQHHPKRALLDVCASLDANALASAGLGNLASAGLGAQADLCLCASLFPLDLRLVLGAGVNLVTGLLGLGGEAAVNARLKALVRSLFFILSSLAVLTTSDRSTRTARSARTRPVPLPSVRCRIPAASPAPRAVFAPATHASAPPASSTVTANASRPLADAHRPSHARSLDGARIPRQVLSRMRSSSVARRVWKCVAFTIRRGTSASM
jgi:hypothetical protein